jgi:inositol polyphosphate 5-phosphatase INPP5B/F
VFWFGDLNYRINVVRDYALDHLDMGGIETLKRYDQLLEEKANIRVFEGMTEPQIGFVPTYKYDPGTNNWDSRYRNSVSQAIAPVMQRPSY